MSKNFWFKFEWKAWLDDRDLARCSLETQGFWIRCICLMEELETWCLEGSIDQIANIIGRSKAIVTRCINELSLTKAAEIVKSQDFVNITSRRLLKRHNLREYNKLQKRKERKRKNVKNESNNSSKDKSFKVLDDSSKKEESKTPNPPFKPVGEIRIWLDAVAVAMGAKDSLSLPKIHKWESVCLIAIREDRSLDKFLSVIKAERVRLGGEMHFFSPDNCLQVLQTADLQKEITRLPTTAENLADAAANDAVMRPPPTAKVMEGMH